METWYEYGKFEATGYLEGGDGRKLAHQCKTLTLEPDDEVTNTMIKSNENYGVTALYVQTKRIPQFVFGLDDTIN